MSFQKKVSVIIPNFNYAIFLDKAIESVLAQTYRNVETIVVNNGSTDNSLSVLDRYRNQILVIDQPNLGQSGARNAGLELATGDLIAFLDADDFWDSRKLELQVQLINEETQLVYSGIAPFQNQDGEKLPILMPKYKGDCSRYFIEQPGESIVLSGESTAIFSRHLLDEVGLFDSRLNSTAGWDFFRRCSIHTNFEFVDKPLVNYRLHTSNMSKSHHNVIVDMRKAYDKLFNDENWSITKKTMNITQVKLEWSFLKTYLKAHQIMNAYRSGINLLKVIPKFF